jgi:HEAT repeat protein
MKDEVIINGVQIGPSTDLRSLLKSQLLEGTLLAGRYDESSEEGIWSLFRAAKGTTLEPRLVEAVGELITDPDERVRSGAVDLAQAFAEKFQAGDLLAVLTDQAKLFEGVASPTSGQPDLAWGLLRAIAAAKNWTPKVASRIRSAALDPVNGLSVLAGLVNHDPNWVIEHLQQLVTDQPVRAEVILFRLKDPILRERLVRAIPNESPSLKQLIAGAVAKEIRDEGEKRKLLRLLTAA